MSFRIGNTVGGLFPDRNDAPAIYQLISDDAAQPTYTAGLSTSFNSELNDIGVNTGSLCLVTWSDNTTEILQVVTDTSLLKFRQVALVTS